MLSEAFRTQFRAAAAKDGQLIERVISHFYAQAQAVRAGDCYFIDGGAHGGYHTFQMAALENVKRVIAIEANAATFQSLKRRWNDSPNRDKVVLVEAALQNDPDRRMISFLPSTSHPGRSGINPVMRNAAGTEFGEAVPVKATTIDAVSSDARDLPCRFIKLDLEGGEFHAFQGGTGVLERWQPVCVFEKGRHSPTVNRYTIEDYFALFSRRGLQFMTGFGDPATRGNVEDFWYAWAFPIAELGIYSALLKQSFRTQFAE